jgi:predicted nucleic acid-binding protein
MTAPRVGVGLTLDAGALIAVERREARTRAFLAEARQAGQEVVIPAGVLAQVWRNGEKQVALTRFLKSRIGLRTPRIEPLDARNARWAGEICAAAGTSDVIDASVVISARLNGNAVVTSDPEDIRAFDARVAVIPV